MTANTDPTATSRKRELLRLVAAGGSVVMAGGAALVAGNAGPAAADHGDDFWRVPTRNWEICNIPTAPGQDATMAVNWGLGQLQSTSRISVLHGCSGRKNVTIGWGDYPNDWWAETWCASTGSFPNCNTFLIRFNSRTINQTPNPASLWRTAACHELGHAAGLGHRTDTLNSCMATGVPSPPISNAFDRHDRDSIVANYP